MQTMQGAAVCGALALGFCLAGRAGAAGEEVPVALESMHERIPGWMAEADVDGLTVAVVREGQLVWSRAYGMASVELERPAGTTTEFEAASLGKVVFSLIVLRLADAGILDLDASIAADFTYPILDHDPRFARLTPRIILEHASGLPNWGSYALAEKRDPVEFRADPGSGFFYSGEAYTALQAYVENRTGRSLEELFQDLAAEADMPNSSFLNRPERADRYARARGRDGQERAVMPFDRPGSAYSLITTAEDLARFMAFFFAGGGLSEKVYATALRAENPAAPDAWGAYIPEGADIGWSPAWGVQHTAEGRIYFHGGNNGQFRSFMAYSEDRRTGVAVMANGEAGLSFLPELMNPLVGDITPAAVWWGYEAPPSGD